MTLFYLFLFETKNNYFLVEINLIFTPITLSKRHAPNAIRLIAKIGIMIYIDSTGNFVIQSWEVLLIDFSVELRVLC
jgi:hypothetical protein